MIRRFWWLRRLFTQPKTLYECRHCGTNAESNTQICQQCGHDGIAVYDLS